MAKRESKAALAARVGTVIDLLIAAYPNAHAGLDFTTPFELLIATILSAQCTDARVNIVTKDLFKKYHAPEDILLVPIEEFEQDIHSTGFYKAKARNIRGCCQRLIDTFNSEVPATLDELVTLPGVGRKTANCVLSNCFNIPGITVDTHVTRIMNLLGVVATEDAVKIEYTLMNLVPTERWNVMNHALITHGRQTCIARRPQCSVCPVLELCPSAT